MKRLFFFLWTLLIIAWIAGGACTFPTIEEPYRTLDNKKQAYAKSGNIQPLLESLTDTDLRVRAAAAAYLGKLGDPRAIPALRRSLDDRSRYVREEAAHALERLGEQPPPGARTQDVPLPDASGLKRALARARIYTTQGGAYPLDKTSLRSLAFSPDGRFIAAGYSLGGFVIWDAVEGHRYIQSAYYNRSRYYRTTHYDTSVCFSPDGKAFAVAEGAAIEMHGMDGRLLWREPHAHEDSPGFSDIGTTAVLSPAAPLLASGGRDGAVCLWDTHQGRRIARLKAEGRPVTALALSPDGGRLAAGDKDGVLRIWDTNTQTLAATEQPRPAEVTCLVFTPDGRYLIAGFMDGTIARLDGGRGSFRKRLAGHEKAVKAIAVSPDGRVLASAGDDARIFLWDLETGTKLACLEGHENWVEAAAFSPDGSLLATGGKDGTLRLWRVFEGREILKLVNLEFYDWIAITPRGDLNAPLDAADHIQIRLDEKRYPLEHIFSHCYRPETVRRVLAGLAPDPDQAGPQGNLGSPPLVEIHTPETETVETRIPVIVSARDAGDGIATLALFHNGRRVSTEGGERSISVQRDPRRLVRRFDVYLAEGENRFRAVATSGKGVVSEGAERRIFCRRPAEDTDLYVLAVGIDAYRNPDLNLNYAESDARGVASFFRSRTSGLFHSVHVTEILNEQATAAAIRKALGRMTETSGPQDAVVLYFCGHGESLDGRWYFLPHDLVYPERAERLKTLGISSDEMARTLHLIRARKVLLIMDSCKSGAALVSFRGVENRRAFMQLARATGVYVIAATSQDQTAAEVHELGHGIFTHTLLRGLYGEAVKGSSSTVTVKRLLAYIEEQLPLLSQQHRQRPQYPMIYSRGMDFPLALTE